MTNSPGEDAGGGGGILARSSSNHSPRIPPIDRAAKPGESNLAREDDQEPDGEDASPPPQEEAGPLRDNGGQHRAGTTAIDHPGTSSSPSSKGVDPGETGGDDDVDHAAGSFDCNICLELAQDPVVTLCGHLFCWPCLYKWMQLRPICKECPVCKAPVHEEKVIPLYGRGCVESSSGHRDAATSSLPDMEIPSRPPGHRHGSSSSSSSDPHHQASLAAWHHHARRLYDPYGGIGFVAGAAAGPGASARFGNVTFSAGFGLFPSLFRLQFHGFPDAPPPPPGSMLPYGPAGSHHHHHHHHLRPVPQPLRPDQQEALLSRLLLFVGGVMILCFLYF